jgi:GNAT superfamily N-acetyltransferase
VDSVGTLADFHGIGSVSFHVPIEWFTEVFDRRMPVARPRFRCWVAYCEGSPVATAAAVRTGGVLGLYNIATAPLYRKKGFAEAITRYVVNAADAEALVLQSTSHGFRLYERLGFRAVTRFLVYNSMP